MAAFSGVGSDPVVPARPSPRVRSGEPCDAAAKPRGNGRTAPEEDATAGLEASTVAPVADGGPIAGTRLVRLLHRAITLRGREQNRGRQSAVGTGSFEGEAAGSAALVVGEFDDGNAIVRSEGKEELVDLAAECLDGLAQFPAALLRVVEHGLNCGILVRPLKQKMGHGTVSSHSQSRALPGKMLWRQPSGKRRSVAAKPDDRSQKFSVAERDNQYPFRMALEISQIFDLTHIES